MRKTDTFASKVFADQSGNQVKTRPINTFQSTVFADPLQNKINRTKLGGESKGTEVLFGAHVTQFEKSSINPLITPVEDEISRKVAEEKAIHPFKGTDGLARDFYGEAAEKYGVNQNKRDGALMAQGVDWKNAHHKPIDADPILKTQGLASKERKYQNLQSSVFGGGYVEEAPIVYNTDVPKVAFGSNADWKTEAGMARPNNGVTAQNPYREK